MTYPSAQTYDRGEHFVRDVVESDNGERMRWTGSSLDVLARLSQNAQTLRHPGFASREETTPDLFTVSMPEGSRGDAILSSGRIPEELVVLALLQVCDAVGFAHAHDLTLGDLSLADLTIDIAGTVTISHFGVPNANDDHARYVAPDDPIDARSDIFSIGVILLELILGFKGEYKTLVGASYSDPNVSGPLRDIAVRATLETKEQRFKDVDGLIGALTAVLAKYPNASRSQLGEWASANLPTGALTSDALTGIATGAFKTTAPAKTDDEEGEEDAVTNVLKSESGPMLGADAATSRLEPAPEVLTMSGFNRLEGQPDPTVAVPAPDVDPTLDDDPPTHAMEAPIFDAGPGAPPSDATIPMDAANLPTTLPQFANAPAEPPEVDAEGNPVLPDYITMPNKWGNQIQPDPTAPNAMKKVAEAGRDAGRGGLEIFGFVLSRGTAGWQNNPKIENAVLIAVAALGLLSMILLFVVGC